MPSLLQIAAAVDALTAQTGNLFSRYRLQILARKALEAAEKVGADNLVDFVDRVAAALGEQEAIALGEQAEARCLDCRQLVGDEHLITCRHFVGPDGRRADVEKRHAEPTIGIDAGGLDDQIAVGAAPMPHGPRCSCEACAATPIAKVYRDGYLAGAAGAAAEREREVLRREDCEAALEQRDPARLSRYWAKYCPTRPAHAPEAFEGGMLQWLADPGAAAADLKTYREGYLAGASDEATEQDIRRQTGAAIADMGADELREIARLLDYLPHISLACRRAALRLARRCREVVDLLGHAKRQAPELIPDRGLPARVLAELETREPLLQFFSFDHLAPELQAYSQPFAELAIELVGTLPDNAQREAALSKLLQAKDCAVRARIYKKQEAR